MGARSEDEPPTGKSAGDALYAALGFALTFLFVVLLAIWWVTVAAVAGMLLFDLARAFGMAQ